MQEIPQLNTDIWVTSNIDGSLLLLKVAYNIVCSHNPNWPILLLVGDTLDFNFNNTREIIEFVTSMPGIFICKGPAEINTLKFIGQMQHITGAKSMLKWIDALPASYKCTVAENSIYVGNEVEPVLLARTPKSILITGTSTSTSTSTSFDQQIIALEHKQLYNMTKNTMITIPYIGGI